MGYELMDKAIEELNGVLPQKDNKLTRDSAGNRLFALADGHLVRFSSIAFENRAKELGWINGYKYGVEYPTNGKKPNLPDDLLVCAIDLVWYVDPNQPRRVSEVCWETTSKFRIVDERCKPTSKTKESRPKTENVSNNSWYERRELPPEGIICEANLDCFLKVKTLDAVSCGLRACVEIKEDESYGKVFWACLFRPIKTEREKFIEAASLVLAKNPTAMPNELLGMLYDADFRAPKTNKEQNDVE